MTMYYEEDDDDAGDYSYGLDDNNDDEARPTVVLMGQKRVFIATSFQGSMVEKSFLFDVASKIYIATDTTPVEMAAYELCCDMIDVTVDISGIYGAKEKDGEVISPFDDNSYAEIRLKTDQVMFLRQLNKHLALVCVIRGENFEKQGLIDYNFNIFKKSIEEVFMVRRHMQEESRRSS
ncbi:hypothetical protein GCK32_006767 [Trichostrongylus colubriformis]|uniref:Uncharacterized protein n=1 Tax=Trichostrongylus colubriformis TaxID=6319 RepID=A0AAN8J1N8_TRICO